MTRPTIFQDFAINKEAQPSYDRCAPRRSDRMFTQFWKVAWRRMRCGLARLRHLFEGAISPLDSALDLVVAFTLIRLAGWP